MDKKQFVTAIAEKTGWAHYAITEILDAARDVASEEIKRGGDVKLKGWMAITGHDSAERPGRNPKTGETITIPAHRRVKIKAAEGFGK